MILWDLSIPPAKRVAFHTTVLPKSVRIFYNKCTFNKTLSQLKMDWTSALSKEKWNWPISCLNDSETQES